MWNTRQRGEGGAGAQGFQRFFFNLGLKYEEHQGGGGRLCVLIFYFFIFYMSSFFCDYCVIHNDVSRPPLQFS